MAVQYLYPRPLSNITPTGGHNAHLFSCRVEGNLVGVGPTIVTISPDYISGNAWQYPTSDEEPLYLDTPLVGDTDITKIKNPEYLSRNISGTPASNRLDAEEIEFKLSFATDRLEVEPQKITCAFRASGLYYALYDVNDINVPPDYLNFMFTFNIYDGSGLYQIGYSSGALIGVLDPDDISTATGGFYTFSGMAIVKDQVTFTPQFWGGIPGNDNLEEFIRGRKSAWGPSITNNANKYFYPASFVNPIFYNYNNNSGEYYNEGMLESHSGCFVTFDLITNKRFSYYHIGISDIEIEVIGNPANPCNLFLGNYYVDEDCTLTITGAGNLNSGLTLYVDSQTSSAISLFTKGFGGEVNNNVPLRVWTLGTESGVAFDTQWMHIHSYLPASGALDLFIASPSSGLLEATFPLMVNNDGLKTAFQSLYLANNPGSGNANTPFYINSFLTESGYTSLYVNSEFSDQEALGSINLYMLTDSPQGQTPLFIKNVLLPLSGGLSLRTLSSLNESGSIPLYISGGGIALKENNVPLYISNYDTMNSGVDFTTIGNITLGGTNFLLKTEDYTGLSGNTTFFTQALGESGLYKGFDLFLNAEQMTGPLNLFLQTDASATHSGGLNIVMLNDNTSSLPALLFLNQDGGVLNSGVQLYVAGAGDIDGFFVDNDSLNLYMARSSESVGSVQSLVLQGPNGESINTTLYMSGGYITNNSVFLNIPSTSSAFSGNATLFCHGF